MVKAQKGQSKEFCRERETLLSQERNLPTNVVFADWNRSEDCTDVVKSLAFSGGGLHYRHADSEDQRLSCHHRRVLSDRAVAAVGRGREEKWKGRRKV